MKAIINLTLGMAALTASSQAAIIVQENFDYSDGDLATLNGGTGWSTAWQTGNASGTRRFTVSSSTALYQGGGNGTYTEQNRTFASGITLATNTTVTVQFTLLRPEAQAGRGIGIYLTNGGANQYFIGKEVNDAVGLKSSMTTTGIDYAEFSTSGTSEVITTVFTFDGVNTNITLSDSNETLTTYSVAGAFSFDGISVAGYNGATTTNGVDNISIDVTTASIPEPGASSLLGLAGIALVIRRRR